MYQLFFVVLMYQELSKLEVVFRYFVRMHSDISHGGLT